MQRIICDQLVRCMETHNKNIFARRVDPHNEMTMRACVEILLKHGHVPVVTVQNVGTMEQYQYHVNRSKVLSENCANMTYTQLSLAKKDGSEVEEYSKISIPAHAI